MVLNRHYYSLMLGNPHKAWQAGGAMQSKGNGDLNLVISFLQAELSARGVWEDGSPLCISSMDPFWYSGSI